MKNIGKYLLSIGVFALLFASCKEDIPEREASPEVSSDCIGVYFPSANQLEYELDPIDPTTVTVTVARKVTSGAVSVPLTVVSNDDNIFTIPASVDFADGAAEASFNVSFPEAGTGTAYTFEVEVVGEKYVDPYAVVDGYPSIAKTVTRIKWEPIETAIMIEGVISTFFGVGLDPFYVEAYKATLGGGVTRYRFVNPFRVMTAEDWDEYGVYDGYPYNAEADMLPGDYYMIINVEANGDASMVPSELGFDWGYGSFSIGSIYGNLSTNIDSYPLGVCADDMIVFGANSLYISMANYNSGGKYPCGTPTVIYLTMESYLADMESAEE